jgi:hypothetical protein
MRRMTGTALTVLILAWAAAAHADPPPDRVAGFVDAGWSGNLDRRDDQFAVNQAEVDVTRAWDERGDLRLDLEWAHDGASWTTAVEQGWLSWRLPGRGAALTLGKFNAPIGWEVPDAPDMLQFSHGLLFTYCTPTNLTGLMFASPLGAGPFDLKAYAANGWDQDVETNGVKTFGGRLGWTRAGRGGLGVSIIGGEDDLQQAVRRTVLDIDATFTPTDRLTLGAEFNIGSIDVGAGDLGWTGLMVMAHAKLGADVGLTGRFDTIDDADDAIFGAGAGQRRSSLTVAPVFALGEGMRALAELRLDMSDADAFTDHDGVAKDTTTSAAFTMTYSF